MSGMAARGPHARTHRQLGLPEQVEDLLDLARHEGREEHLLLREHVRLPARRRAACKMQHVQLAT